MSNSTFIDLSHTIYDGLVTYKGLPSPVISDYLSREHSQTRYEPGTEFQIGKIEMIANTGTYIDSPFHRYPDGPDVAAFDLASIANLEGVLIHHVREAEHRLEIEKFPDMQWNFPLRANRAITATTLEGIDVRGKAVLFHTGWDMRWRSDDYANGEHVYLDSSAAEFLAQNGARLLGIDCINIDDTRTGARPAHTILLAHNIPIVEHLCGLRELPPAGFRFFAVPPKVRDFGSFPVRAFAIVG